jgi:hypothetical protein
VLERNLFVTLPWVIVTVRQQSAHSFSTLHSIQGAGKGNLKSNYESPYGPCARRIRSSASSVQCYRTVLVPLSTSVLRRGARPWRGARRAAALGLHLARRVKDVSQGRRFDPDIRPATDAFRGKRYDVAVEILLEGRPGNLQLGRVAALRRDQHEDRPQQPGAASVACIVLPGGQQVGFLQQGVEPVIRQMLG